MTATLEIEGLSKTYTRPEDVRALGGVSLRVAAGEFCLVQGPSGSGKTTLLLAAGGLLAPSQGAVRVDGQDLFSLPPEARARWRASRIGFVFQQFHLIPFLSVMENVLTPCLALPLEGARERAARLLDEFGLGHRASHLPPELSVGERQRTALARALLRNPRLILADEPTGNLDRKNADAVLGHLRSFAHQGGAVLMATHQEGIDADRVFRLEDGRLSPGGEARP